MHHRGHFHFIKFAINRELSELYISIFIRSLAFGMIGIFVPLYLLKEIGYSLQSVIFFYIIFSIIFAIFSPIAAKISSKIGFKHSMLISSPLFVLFFALLYLLKSYNIELAILALVAAVADALFWISFHTDFAKFSDKKRRGAEVGLWHALVLAVGVSGPLIGAFLITFFSFKILFIVVGALIIGSTIPLFFSKEIYESAPFSLRYVFSRSHIKDMISFIGSGMRMVGGEILWPIFIFFALKEYLSLGIIVSIVGFITAAFTVYVGKLTDIFKKRTLIKIGSFFDSFTWFFRIFARTGLQIFAFMGISELLYTLVDVPFSALTYDKANESNVVEYIVFREIMLCIGRILILVIVLLIGLNAGIFSTGIASLLHMFF